MPAYTPAKIKQLNSGTYKLIDISDLDAGSLDVVMTLLAGGQITANGILGEIVVQTGSGTPTHTASEGTLYWDTAGDILYGNADGATGWIAAGGGSSGSSSVGALGTGAVAGTDSAAIGNNATASGNYNTAVGVNADAANAAVWGGINYQTAVGYAATASVYSTVLGANANANWKSVAHRQ